ncbi:hypothetical protein SALBM311S_05858 [Streptomyces alboniger]
MLDVPLEVPLTAFAFGRFLQGHHTGTAGIEMFGEPLVGRGARPSKTMTRRRPVSLIQLCSFSSSICWSRLCRSYSPRSMRWS